MALTDNATNGRILKEAYGKGKLTLTADCEVGDLLTKDGALADASAATTMADWVALDKALSGVEIEVAKVATIGGLTLAALGDLVYLSNTAGGYGSAAGTVEQVVGQALSATDILVMPKWTFMESGNIKVPDLMLLGIGTGNTARFSWDTTDANGNKLLLQMPAGGSVDVPVLVVGQLIEAIDLALYNGVVDPRLAFIGVGAVTTGPGLDFRKARGTAAAPTVVTSGDDLGTIRAYGAVAAAEWVQAAEIRFDMAGTIATTRGPGTITFLTATDAAPSVLTQAMIISAAQLVTVASLTSTGAAIHSSTTALNGDVTVADDILLGLGTGNTARFSYDTTDANANALLLQLPAGGAVDVPVLAIGQGIESVDLTLYNGVVDPRIALFGVGAVATATGIDFRKARGTIAAPTVVTTGDDLGTIRAYGAVANAEYVQAAEIRFDMAGTIATTRGPGTITFLTATDAAPSVLTQAMIISAAQLVTVAAGLTLTTGDLTIAAGGVTATSTALNAVSGRVGKFFGTVAAPNQGDGYGAFEVDITASGVFAGTTNAFSSWLNVATGADVGGNMVCAQNNGIYLPTGTTATSAKMIMGMRMQYVDDDGDNPGSLFCFSTNIYSNVLTALFDVNAIVDLGGSTGAQAGNDYKIPLLRDASAGVTWYVNVYHS